MLKRLFEGNVNIASGSVTAYSAAIDMNYAATVSIQSVVDVTAGAVATISYQKSNVVTNGVASTTLADWTDIDTPAAVTVDATFWYEKIGPAFRFLRVASTMTSGTLSINNKVLVRGEDP